MLGNVIPQGKEEPSEINKTAARFTDDKIAKFKNGSVAMYERGIIRYGDVFGSAVHETAYCLRYDASTGRFVEYGGEAFNYMT